MDHKEQDRDLKFRLVATVGEAWFRDVKAGEFKLFVQWARESQTYCYPGREKELGDAFRGFVLGLRVARVGGIDG